VPSLVADSPIASAWCFPDERTNYTEAVFETVRTTVEAAAPILLAYELRNSVLMGVRRQRISHTHATNFLEMFRRLPIHLTDPVSCDRVLDLAVRHRLTFYDAAWLDLALRGALPACESRRRPLRRRPRCRRTDLPPTAHAVSLFL